VIAIQECAEKYLQRELGQLSHREITQARRDLKTMSKTYAITHDPQRKRNAEVLAQIEDRKLKSRITEEGERND